MYQVQLVLASETGFIFSAAGLAVPLIYSIWKGIRGAAKSKGGSEEDADRTTIWHWNIFIRLFLLSALVALVINYVCVNYFVPSSVENVVTDQTGDTEQGNGEVIPDSSAPTGLSDPDGIADGAMPSTAVVSPAPEALTDPTAPAVSADSIAPSEPMVSSNPAASSEPADPSGPTEPPDVVVPSKPTVPNEPGVTPYLVEEPDSEPSIVPSEPEGISISETNFHEDGTVCFSACYTDLGVDAWYHDAVDFVIEHGLMDDYSDDCFHPDDMLTNSMALPALDGIASYAYGEEITSYTSNPPDAFITRENLAVAMWLCADCPDIRTNGPVLADEDQISSFAVDAMKWVVSVGIIASDEEGNIQPEAVMSRAVFAALLMRFYEVIT